MNDKIETKSEIRARIDELNAIKKLIQDQLIINLINDRLNTLKLSLISADEDLHTSILKSHQALCSIKQMGEKEAYGHNPALYYSLGICGEAGEMANAIVKAMRFGPGLKDQYIFAIESELPDVIIYSYVLAHTHDINLTKLVNKKVDVVIQRAMDGYYGGPMSK